MQNIVAHAGGTGPVSIFALANQATTIAAVAAAGDQQILTVTNSEILAGDFVLMALSVTAAAGGVVLSGGVSLAAGSIAVQAVGTKIFAGGAVADLGLVVARPLVA